MQLKEYQSKVLEKTKLYLEELSKNHEKYSKLMKVDPDVATDFDFCNKI